MGLDEEVNEMVEEFYRQNTSSPITFRKKGVRRKLTQKLGREPTDIEVGKAGIRKAIELIILTTITDCYKAEKGDNSSLQHRLQQYKEQDERYTLRLLKKTLSRFN